MNAQDSRHLGGDLQGNTGRSVNKVGAHTATGGRQAGSAAAARVVSRLLPGPRYISIYLLALPVVVVAFASTGWGQIVSGLIALTWLVLAPVALYARWAAMVLPLASALFLALGVLVLPLNSAAFVVDLVAAAIMMLVTFPRAEPQVRVAAPRRSSEFRRSVEFSLPV